MRLIDPAIAVPSSNVGVVMVMSMKRCVFFARVADMIASMSSSIGVLPVASSRWTSSAKARLVINSLMSSARYSESRFA